MQLRCPTVIQLYMTNVTMLILTHNCIIYVNHVKCSDILCKDHCVDVLLIDMNLYCRNCSSLFLMD